MSTPLVRPVDQILDDMKPAKTSKAYDAAYEGFSKQVGLAPGHAPSEEQMMGYFDFLHKQKKMAPSSLWTVYSQINRMVQIQHGFKLQCWPRITRAKSAKCPNL